MNSLMHRARFCVFSVLALLANALIVAATDQPLASHYPGDIGIEKNPAVLFADNFESGNLRRWDQVRGSLVVVSNSAACGWALRAGGDVARQEHGRRRDQMVHARRGSRAMCGVT
jgi:hypothetical protein